MFGNILLGGYVEGDTTLGIYTAEVTANISKSSGRIVFRGHAVFSSYHTKFRIPGLDITVDLQDADHKRFPGVGFGAYGNFDEFGTTLYSGIGIGSYSKFIRGELVAQGYNPLYLASYCHWILEHPDQNSVAWSNIGFLDFTIGQDNVAGMMPVDWNGYVYAVERLGMSNIVYVYGANGISKLTPSGVYWGREQISNIGIKSKHAVVNTHDSHYFVANNHNLYKISRDNVITKLGYSEFLQDVDDMVMTYDNYNKVIYICNGVIGYMYSEDTDSFAQGPANVTGVRWLAGDMYVMAPSSDIEIPSVSIVTDIYDMGTKKEKTIFELLITCDDTSNLTCAIDYRMGRKEEFKTTPWVQVDKFGIARLPCYGREFRFRFVGEVDKIESIVIDGVVHGFSFLDTITIK